MADEGMTMTAKERADVLVKLAEFRMSRVSSRRDHEWKVTLALWALLAGGIAVPPKLPLWGVAVFAGFLLTLTIVHAALWVADHWAKSREDILVSFFYAERAHNLVLPREEHRELEAWPKLPSKKWALGIARCWAQILTTALLALAVIFRCAFAP